VKKNSLVIKAKIIIFKVNIFLLPEIISDGAGRDECNFFSNIVLPYLMIFWKWIIPKELRKLKKSSNIEKNGGKILTQVALNQYPELILASGNPEPSLNRNYSSNYII